MSTLADTSITLSEPLVHIPPPCRAFCGKCGSASVVREFHQKGEEMEDKAKFRGVGEGFWSERKRKGRSPWEHRIVLKDLILHTCQVCGFEWPTDTLHGGGDAADAIGKISQARVSK